MSAAPPVEVTPAGLDQFLFDFMDRNDKEFLEALDKMIPEDAQKPNP